MFRILRWILLRWLLTLSWTNPTSENAGGTASASRFNTNVINNLLWLFNGEALQAVRFLANYSTTSTSFVDIDATNLIITKAITTGRALVVFIGCSADIGSAAPVATTDWGAFDIIVDSTTRAGDATYGTLIWNQINNSGAGAASPVVVALFTGLSAGTHTFKPQWKTNNGANALRLRPSSVAVNTNGTQQLFLMEL